MSLLGSPRIAYARLAYYLADVSSLVPGLSELCGRTATRTATGLVRTGTEWTKTAPRIIESRLNKRGFRTQKDGLERVQANS